MCSESCLHSPAQTSFVSQCCANPGVSTHFSAPQKPFSTSLCGMSACTSTVQTTAKPFIYYLVKNSPASSLHSSLLPGSLPTNGVTPAALNSNLYLLIFEIPPCLAWTQEGGLTAPSLAPADCVG